VTRQETEELIKEFPLMPGNFWGMEAATRFCFKHERFTGFEKMEVYAYMLGYSTGQTAKRLEERPK